MVTMTMMMIRRVMDYGPDRRRGHWGLSTSSSIDLHLARERGKSYGLSGSLGTLG